MEQRKNETISLPTIEQVERERKRYRRQKAYNKALGGTVYVLTIVAAVAVLIATLVLPVLQIEGTSMEPTLKNGDIVLLTNTTNFDREELCAFAWNNKLLIKRVIGIPGDWIEIDTDGTVYLNGEQLEEPYTEQDIAGFEKTTFGVSKATVGNSKGVELPSTGGKGTTMLITFGSMVAIAFAVFLITHKKMSIYTD